MSNNVPWTSKPSRGVLTLFWLSTENKVHVAHESEVTTNFVRKRHEKEQHAFFKSQVHGRSSVMVVKEAIFKSETSRDQCQCCLFFFFSPISLLTQQKLCWNHTKDFHVLKLFFLDYSDQILFLGSDIFALSFAMLSQKQFLFTLNFDLF